MSITATPIKNLMHKGKNTMQLNYINQAQAQAVSSDSTPKITLYIQEGEKCKGNLIYSTTKAARDIINETYALPSNSTFKCTQVKYAGTQGEFLRKFVLAIIEPSNEELEAKIKNIAKSEENPEEAEKQLKSMFERIRTIAFVDKTEE